MHMKILNPLPSISCQMNLKHTYRTLIRLETKCMRYLTRKTYMMWKFWQYFILKFWPHSLQSRPKGLTYKWCELLQSRGVHFESSQELYWPTSLTKVLFKRETIQYLRQYPTTSIEKQMDAIFHQRALCSQLLRVPIGTITVIKSKEHSNDNRPAALGPNLHT